MAKSREVGARGATSDQDSLMMRSSNWVISAWKPNVSDDMMTVCGWGVQRVEREREESARLGLEGAGGVEDSTTFQKIWHLPPRVSSSNFYAGPSHTLSKPGALQETSYFCREEERK